MKTVLLIFGVLLLTCIVFYFSFYKKASYKMQIINETGLELTQAIAHFDYKTNGISVGIGESSPIYVTKYQETIWNFFGPGSLKVLVQEYVNEEGKTIKNGIGKSIRRDRMSKDKLNIITFYGKPDKYAFDVRFKVKE